MFNEMDQNVDLANINMDSLMKSFSSPFCMLFGMKKNIVTTLLTLNPYNLIGLLSDIKHCLTCKIHLLNKIQA